MGRNLIERLQQSMPGIPTPNCLFLPHRSLDTDWNISEIELYRLQQRYTRRKNHSEAFSSEAQYVDGEYIYECQRNDTVGKRGLKERVKEIGAVEKERS